MKHVWLAILLLITGCGTPKTKLQTANDIALQKSLDDSSREFHEEMRIREHGSLQEKAMLHLQGKYERLADGIWLIIRNDGALISRHEIKVPGESKPGLYDIPREMTFQDEVLGRFEWEKGETFLFTSSDGNRDTAVFRDEDIQKVIVFKFHPEANLFCVDTEGIGNQREKELEDAASDAAYDKAQDQESFRN